MKPTPQFRADNGPDPKSRISMLVAVLLVTAMGALDTSVVNVALPAISAHLAASSAEVVQVVSAYQMTIAVVLLPLGALAEAFGSRRVFLFCVGLFVTASAACAFAPSLPALLAFRIAQGVGGGGILILNIALLRAALDRLQALRDRLGKPLIVRSAYRSPEHNRAVGGAPRSKHLDGAAFDIAMANHDPVAFEAAAREVGFLGLLTTLNSTMQ